MKIDTRKQQAVGGGVLMYSLGVGALVGLALAGYLTLVSNENYCTERSQAWNACIAVVEAGIEDALAHINSAGISNLASQGWSASAGSYDMERYLGESHYLVKISAADPPVITSRGCMPLPLGDGQVIYRTVECKTIREPMFSHAMLARDKIDLKGNTINTDSFNSTDTNYSTGGLYDYTKRRDHGDVATNSSLTNSLNVGNASIAGRVLTGPGGSVHLGPNGSVGDAGWVGTNNGAIQPGYFSDDMNVSLVDVEAPDTGGLPPAPGVVNGTNYDFVLGSDRYAIAVVRDQSIYVVGHATLLVTAELKISSGGIYIAPGASLSLYVAAPSATIAGNGIVNYNSSASSFYYFGLPTNTKVSLSGNASWTGCVYAPNADLTLGGGGSTPYDFVGSVVSRTVTMNGNFNFHYDEALAALGPMLLYVATTWNEI